MQRTRTNSYPADKIQRPITLYKRKIKGTPYDQMRFTIRRIGRAIKEGAEYLPIRNHSAGLATLAGPKDYFGQVSAIFDDFIRRWRYVKDPYHKELITAGPHALYQLVIAGDGRGMGHGRGAGDCDCASAAMGAMLRSIGLPVRLATTAPLGFGPGKMFGHVFVQAYLPKRGWVTVDPVVYPAHGVGYTPPHSRIAFYDLEGNLTGTQGNARGMSGSVAGLGGIDMREGMTPMEYYRQSYVGNLPPIQAWQDQEGFLGVLGGLDGLGQYEEPEDWRSEILDGFGAYAEDMGLIDGAGLSGLAAEAEPDVIDGQVVYRTPMLELDADDYGWVAQYGRPYHGMLALGDTGQVYAYDGELGFFKKLFKKAKRAVKKIGRKIKKVIKKIPGGKYLVKLGSKVWKLSKKFVKPLVKFVGKYAAKLAPVAALIPGYGPAIAAALYTAGKVAKLMTKYGVKIRGAAGKLRKLKFKSGKSAKQFQRALKREAAKALRAKKRGTGRRRVSGRRRKVVKLSRRRTPKFARHASMFARRFR